MINRSNSRSSSSSFFPSHLLFVVLSVFLLFLPSLTVAQTVAATLPATMISPMPTPINAAITYSVNARSTIAVVLIQTLQNQNERTVGESATTVNAGNNQQTTIQNVKINNILPASGGGIAYKWRVYSVNPDAYAFSPSIAFNAATASREYPVTVTAAPTTPPTTTTTTTKAPVGTTIAPAATTRPITTLRASTAPPNNGGPGDQPIFTNPPDGIVYKIISSTAVAGRWAMCAYTYTNSDTLPGVVIKLETTLARLIQLNLDRFTQDNYTPSRGDVFQYDCFQAAGSLVDGSDDGSDDGSNDGSDDAASNGGQSSSSSSAGSSKSWIDNNVVIFIVVLVVGFCLAAFLAIVLYKHIQAQMSSDKGTKRLINEARPAPPMSTPANKNWGQV